MEILDFLWFSLVCNLFSLIFICFSMEMLVCIGKICIFVATDLEQFFGFLSQVLSLRVRWNIYESRCPGIRGVPKCGKTWRGLALIPLILALMPIILASCLFLYTICINNRIYQLYKKTLKTQYKIKDKIYIMLEYIR